MIDSVKNNTYQKDKLLNEFEENDFFYVLEQLQFDRSRIIYLKAQKIANMLNN